MTSPVQMCWYESEGVARPTSDFWLRRARAQWGDGEVLIMEGREERSTASHSHYFAAVNEAWQNLPEDQAQRFPTSEHLRKWALIRAGYRDERSIVASSKAEAQRLAGFIQPMDSYAVVTISDACVRVYTAQSQSYRAMGRKTFEASKAKVLGVVASLLGVTADELGKAQAA